jgi:lipopolysaccharide biosynthesis regulator YciM
MSAELVFGIFFAIIAIGTFVVAALDEDREIDCSRCGTRVRLSNHVCPICKHWLLPP